MLCTALQTSFSLPPLVDVGADRQPLGERQSVRLALLVDAACKALCDARRDLPDTRSSSRLALVLARHGACEAVVPLVSCQQLVRRFFVMFT